MTAHEPPPHGYGPMPPRPRSGLAYLFGAVSGVLLAAVVVLSVLLVQSRNGAEPAKQAQTAERVTVTATAPVVSDPPADDGRQHYTSTCSVDAASQQQTFTVTISNDSSSLLTVTRFVTIFTDGTGAQVSAITEPSNGTIDGENPITLSKPIGVGQTITLDVEPSSGIDETATACKIESLSGD